MTQLKTRRFEKGESIQLECDCYEWNFTTKVWDLTDLTENYPKFQVYDPDGTAQILVGENPTPESMTNVTTGIYQKTYSIPDDGTAGWWRVKYVAENDVCICWDGFSVKE